VKPLSREFDLILVGATGFVGRLTADDLAQQAPSDLRIGLAGRSADRLAAARDELSERAQGWSLISADISDDADARALSERTRVIVSTAGPYLRCGLPLVTACAEAGTHYTDLTGEAVFVRRSIDAGHERAEATGAKIIHSCGFDSVPSDLGVGLTAQRAVDDDQGALLEAVLHVQSMRGGISGGTVDSLRQMILEAQQDEEARSVTSDPWALVDDPSGRTYGSDHTTPQGPLGITRDDSDAPWHVPFIMGGYNRQIVLRTNSLCGWPYGREFRYREVVDTGRGMPGVVRAASVSVGSTMLLAGMWLPPTRAVLDRLLPDPGQGPGEKLRRNGRFAVLIKARTSTGARYSTRIGADLDPGYGATAVMLTESALALAAGRDLPDRAGVLTPMSALGPVLATHLQKRGFTVSIDREE
jgi:short subunit dehydrogenase-like uncharacterized protein